ncbi:putative pseudouridine synthase, RsuA/RluA, pseudouridine synthase, catalytic domain superfamily [Helianthus anomalus]
MKTGSRIYLYPLTPVMLSAYYIRFFDFLTSDPVLLVLNKPPKVPVKGNLHVHNSMDGLAAAALCYDYDEGPKPVHRLDREGSGITLMGRSKENISHLHWLFSDINRTKSSFKAGNDACYQWYWALIIGTPKENEGLIRAPLTKTVLKLLVHRLWDDKYGWFVHGRWKQMPRANYDSVAGEPYKMRRPDRLDVQKGSALSKLKSTFFASTL